MKAQKATARSTKFHKVVAEGMHEEVTKMQTTRAPTHTTEGHEEDTKVSTAADQDHATQHRESCSDTGATLAHAWT